MWQLRVVRSYVQNRQLPIRLQAVPGGGQGGSQVWLIYELDIVSYHYHTHCKGTGKRGSEVCLSYELYTGSYYSHTVCQ